MDYHYVNHKSRAVSWTVLTLPNVNVNLISPHWCKFGIKGLYLWTTRKVVLCATRALRNRADDAFCVSWWRRQTLGHPVPRHTRFFCRDLFLACPFPGSKTMTERLLGPDKIWLQKTWQLIDKTVRFFKLHFALGLLLAYSRAYTSRSEITTLRSFGT